MTAPRILDATQKQKVSYCIPLWLRDQQIRVNTAAVKGRIEPSYTLRDDPIAIVCYGPSLAKTWEQVRDFKYVMTCSGAHRFLIDRGIIPTWHCEVDPREHKIKLVGAPHPGVEYLIASTCHPKYFEHLKDFNVKLWHVFDPHEDALRILPPGEWALTGGCGAGLRAMTLARFMGFRAQHIFGMDGSEGETGKHAAEHPNQAPDHSIVEYDGKTYRTNPAFLEAARGTWHELNQLHDVTAKFYGEGLVQAMAKNYERKPPVDKKAASILGMIAFVKPELISAEYQRLNQKLHNDNLAYGIGGGKHAETVIKLADSIKTRSVMDYGCGKSFLAKAIPWPIWEYDPAIPGKTESPRPADLVVCTDVLEHIEPDKLDFVLGDLARCVLKVGYFTIHTGPSQKTLADGRNAHLIQAPESWWRQQLARFFKVGKIFQTGPVLQVVVGPKGKTKEEPK